MPTPLKDSTGSNLKHFDWRATETLQRDQEQSHLLHEPKFRIMTTDPITGNNVKDYKDHCSLLVGNMCIYFETEETCKEFQNMEFNHPSLSLPYPPSHDDDRGG